MQKYSANTQLKLLFYIIIVALGVYFIQGKYDIFKFENFQTEREKKDFRISLEKQNGESVPVQVEVADSEKERALGLMNRESMDENKGMLFIFESDTLSGFWMKDTLIPLDMLFIDSKMKIVAIEDSAQPCIETPCTVYNPGVAYRYVVEVNAGWSEKNDIQIGDSFDLSDITSGS